MSKIEIVSGDGKYHTTFDNGRLTITRNGEPWRDETGDGYILSLVQRIEELETVCAEAYQVVGALADKAEVFDKKPVTKALDNLCAGKCVHSTVLPFVV